MASPNNLSESVLSGNTTTLTFFNNFFQPGFTVSQNIDDAVLGFFEQICNNKQAAKILASSIIYTSIAQRLDPMDILANFSKMDNLELNAYITMFLNLNRVGTSFLGVKNSPRVSKYVKRMILP